MQLFRIEFAKYWGWSPLRMPFSRWAAYFAADRAADSETLVAEGSDQGAGEGRSEAPSPAAGAATEGPALAPQVRRWPRGPPATSAPSSPAAAAVAAPAPQAFPWPVTEAEGRLRAYAVWVIPGHPELRGVHVGGTRAWQGILPALPGGFYSYRSGTRLRAYESRRWPSSATCRRSRSTTHRPSSSSDGQRPSLRRERPHPP